MLAPKRKPPRSFKSKQYPPGGIPGVTTNYPGINRSISQETTEQQDSGNNNNNVVIERIGSGKQSVSICKKRCSYCQKIPEHA